MSTLLPITARLIPKGHNMVYLAKSAAITRFLVGGARIYKSHPSQLEQSDMPLVDQKKAFYERIFVELFGTGSNLVAMHLAQDKAAKLFERFWFKNALPDLRQQVIASLAADPELRTAIPRFEQAFDVVFDSNAPGRLIDRVLNGRVVGAKKNRVTVKSTLDHLVGAIAENAKKAGPQAISEANKLIEFLQPTAANATETVMEKFMHRLNSASALTILFGIVAGAIYGGFAIQWLNDRVLGKILTRIYGNGHTSSHSPPPFLHQNLHFASHPSSPPHSHPASTSIVRIGSNLPQIQHPTNSPIIPTQAGATPHPTAASCAPVVSSQPSNRNGRWA